MARSRRSSGRHARGAALIEFCVILPILLLVVFAIIDLGLLIQARLIVTNLVREGGSLASRDIKSPTDLITMLQASAKPLNMSTLGRICVSSIEAGKVSRTSPIISTQQPQTCSGSLGVSSGIRSGAVNLGLTGDVYNHLVFNSANQAADINGVIVVEAFYEYRPVTPLPRLIPNLLLDYMGRGTIIGSRSVFCSEGK